MLRATASKADIVEDAAVVAANGIVKTYGQVAAVDGVSFEISEGEIFGILGRNGAGKTTTIELLCGLLKPDAGSVSVLGADMSVHRTEGQRQIGYVPQDNVVYPALTPRENVGFAAGLRGMTRRHGDERAAHLLDVLGLSAVADRQAAKLSGGERRRTSIAMGLVHQPRVMILDEATASVDVDTRREILDWIRSLRAEGVTTVYTTHYLEEAELLCDRVLFLHEGRAIQCDSVSNLIRMYGTGLVTVRGSFDDHNLVIDDLHHAVPDSDAMLVDGSIVVRVADPQQALVAVLGSVGARSTIDAVEVSMPTLEGAFLSATGERFGSVGSYLPGDSSARGRE